MFFGAPPPPPEKFFYLASQEKINKTQTIFNLACTGGVAAGGLPLLAPWGALGGREELEGGKPSIQGGAGGGAPREAVANICDFPTKSRKSALSHTAERRDKIRFNKI